MQLTINLGEEERHLLRRLITAIERLAANGRYGWEPSPRPVPVATTVTPANESRFTVQTDSYLVEEEVKEQARKAGWTGGGE